MGTTFLGADSAGAQLTSTSPKILAAVVANPGGHIAELLRNSAEFEPIIDGQLAANGLVKGSQAYYDFYSEAQAVVEDGDPANYAAAAAGGHLIHMLEVVGGLDAGSPAPTGPGGAEQRHRCAHRPDGHHHAGHRSRMPRGGRRPWRSSSPVATAPS